MPMQPGIVIDFWSNLLLLTNPVYLPEFRIYYSITKSIRLTFSVHEMEHFILLLLQTFVFFSNFSWLNSTEIRCNQCKYFVEIICLLRSKEYSDEYGLIVSINEHRNHTGSIVLSLHTTYSLVSYEMPVKNCSVELLLLLQQYFY